MTKQAAPAPPAPIVHRRAASISHPARVVEMCECGGQWPCIIAVFGPRHTADCAMCAKPATARGRRILAQFHGWPERKEFPFALLDDQDIVGIEKEAKVLGAKAERARLRKRLAKQGLDLDLLLAPATAFVAPHQSEPAGDGGSAESAERPKLEAPVVYDDEGVRAWITKLAKEQEKEPFVPDTGGGAPGDRFEL